MAGVYLNGLFQQQWRELLGVEPTIDPRFARCTAGGDLEHQAARVARELWRLARRAVEMGLEAAFANDPKETLKELESSEKGREWLAEYRQFLVRDGWRCQRMHAYDTPAWIEDPSLALAEIKLLLSQETFAPDAERERIVREREATEAEVLSEVPGPQREAFRVLMRAARMAGFWSEDHSYYCDLYIGALGRWIVTEFGRRFAEAGCIDDPEDIHFLHPNEIRKAAIPMGRINLRPYAERRKKEYLANLEVEPAPFVGDISQAEAVIRSDPTLLVSAQHPIVREELKADLYGAAAAPGCVEGVARVIMTADRLVELKPGEILVAPGTSTAWMVAFNLIRGLVTDGGGALSHPVIMAREYGLPCVAGCVEATRKIKTGQRIRVDGDRGVVYILDR
jgi:pyruvate,water dikinase